LLAAPSAVYSKGVRAVGLCLLMTVSLSCEAERPSGPVGATPTKASLFGDPALVPTREGERARRELALAGELAEALELVGCARARVTVSLDEDSPRAAIAAQLAPGADSEQTRARAEALARAIVPDLGADDTLAISLAEAPEAEAPEDHPLISGLALLGLGLSLGLGLGVGFERLRAKTPG
jgi:hypothetical protein